MSDIPKHGAGERGVFAFRDGEFVRIDESKKKRVIAPTVITDEIDPVESYADFDRPVFTSKSALRRHYREKGFYETGGDHLDQKPTSEDPEAVAKYDREMIEAAYMDVKYNRVPFTEEEKELHKREKRQWGKAYEVKPL